MFRMYYNHFDGPLTCPPSSGQNFNFSSLLVHKREPILSNWPQLYLLLANMLKYSGKHGGHYAVTAIL